MKSSLPSSGKEWASEFAPAGAPIGALDSGVGGLSVVRSIMELMPHENILYLADSAHCPYGPRSDAAVRDLVTAGADFLLTQGAKIIVVACNTASAAGLTHLRARYGPNVPIIGLVPAVKPAAAATKTGRIAVLATPGTLRGSLLNDVIADFATPAGVSVETIVPEGLVEAIEQGDLEGANTRRILTGALIPLMEHGADGLVLGCTHYPFVSPLIHEIAGPGLTLFDSGAGVARQTMHQLKMADALSNRNATGELTVYTTGETAKVAPVVSRLLGHQQNVLHADYALPDYSQFR